MPDVIRPSSSVLDTASGGDVTVKADGLVRTFGSVRAVDGLSFEVRRGEVFGLLGHNGAGKTTTIRLLNGVLRPTSGRATVLGMDPDTNGPDVRRRTGVLTETPALDEALTAVENLTVYGRICEVDEAELRDRIGDLIETFGLAPVSTVPARQLSMGLKQRLALARALVHDPEILFLDEPTSSMDPLAARQARSVVAELTRRRGRTVVLCTHNLNEAQELCDRVGIIEHGRLLASGSMRDLAARLEMSRGVQIIVGAGATDAAAVVAQGMDGVLTVSPNQDAIHVTVADRDVIPMLVAELVHEDVSLYAVVDDVSTLEDLYVAIHREAGAWSPESSRPVLP